jgi:hypothetical protein
MSKQQTTFDLPINWQERLIGDRTYNPAWHGPDPANRPIDFPRQALHAEVLTLEHPEKNRKRMFWTTELTKDLRQLEATLRSSKHKMDSQRGPGLFVG